MRIQSDEPGFVLTVSEECERRMLLLYPQNTLTCVSNLPTVELQSLITRRRDLERIYKDSVAELNLWSQQLFVVEKRFLVRLKDRDLDVVGKLGELLETTEQKVENHCGYRLEPLVYSISFVDSRVCGPVCGH